MASRRLVERWPEIASYRQQLARKLLAVGAIDEAAAMIRAAEAVDPGNTVTTLVLAEVLEAAGDIAGAMEALQMVVQRAPDLRAARRRLGRLAIRTGDARVAGESFDAILVFDPFDPEALVGRARLRAAAGDLTGALRDLERALQAEPDAPAVVVAEQGLLLRAGRGKVAAAGLAERVDALTSESSRRAVWLRSAALRPLHGDEPGALEMLEAGATRYPSDRRFVEAMVVLLATGGNPAVANGPAALELVNTLAVGPDDPRVTELRAMALAAAGRFDEARGLQEHLLDRAAPSGVPVEVGARYAENLERYRRGQRARPEGVGGR